MGVCGQLPHALYMKLGGMWWSRENSHHSCHQVKSPIQLVVTHYTDTYHVIQIILSTNSKEHSPSWEAVTHNQEIPCLTWKWKVQYCVHKGLSLVPILSHTSLAHTPPPYFMKIHFNILIFMPTSSKWSLPFKPSNFVWNCHPYHVCYMPCPSHSH
jgi:hypothetical protein